MFMQGKTEFPNPLQIGEGGEGTLREIKTHRT